MTEPTRDALHAETLAWLDNDPRGVDWTGAYVERVSAHAAACVRRVPELEAEVERLREIESHIRGLHLPVERDRHDGGGFECARCYTSDGVPSNYPCLTIVALDAAYAAATRDSRPALPADVQAVVEKVQPLAEYEGGTRLAYMDTEEAEMLAADLRTLLAHLQRQDAP